MNKITIKKIPFKLKGDIIEKGNTLSFKAINRENKEVSIDTIKGIKVISVFPDINTSVCDEQTRKIGQLASKHKDVKFISVTTDDVETVNKWCLANDIDNVDIWTDSKYGEFGNVTNMLITKIKKLARGFIILDENNKIIDVSAKVELAVAPDYTSVEKLLG
ncbi:MAG: redoxin family protein [Mycoplasmataceae bacterium]|nr:redoxin family protein [Mycoplasmataceae bacterium]